MPNINYLYFGAVLAAMLLALLSVTSVDADSDIERKLDSLTVTDVKCVGDKYDRDSYGYDRDGSVPGLLEMYDGRVIAPLARHELPSPDYVDVDHLVSLKEAHESGMCRRPDFERREFGRDLANQVFMAPNGKYGNSAKGNQDFAKWQPAYNVCWFVAQVIEVKHKYRLSVGRDEYAALKAKVSSCGSFKMGLPSPHSADLNGNGKVDWTDVRQVIALYLADRQT